jgi:hypothetical protein
MLATDVHTPAHPRATAPHLMLLLGLPAAAALGGLLRPERVVVVAPAHVLRGPRLLLLLGLRMLLLCCTGEHVRGAHPAACNREGGAQPLTRVDPGYMLHAIGPSLVVQGRLVLCSLGASPLWRSSYAHAL